MIAAARESSGREKEGVRDEKYQTKLVSSSRRCPQRGTGWCSGDRDGPVAADAKTAPSPCPGRQAPELGTASTAHAAPTSGLVADGGANGKANTALHKQKSILYKPILSVNHLYLEHLFLLETLKPCYIRACLNPLA